MRRVLTAAAMAAAALTLGSATAAQAIDVSGSADLGGLTSLDGGGLGDTVDGAAQKASNFAGEAGSKAVKKAVPTAGKAVGKAAKTATPAAQKAARTVAGGAGQILGALKPGGH
jgi:hypothetical protein